MSAFAGAVVARNAALCAALPLCGCICETGSYTGFPSRETL